MSLERLFWSRVNKRGKNECWEWIGSLCAFGKNNLQHRGRLKHNGKNVRAHRLSYELNIGPIPPDAWVLHMCDNPLCVNPAHLYLGDHARNMRDMAERQRGRITLTIEQVREMRRIHKMETLTYKALAERFGCSEPHAWRICNGKRRREI